MGTTLCETTASNLSTVSHTWSCMNITENEPMTTPPVTAAGYRGRACANRNPGHDRPAQALQNALQKTQAWHRQATELCSGTPADQLGKGDPSEHIGSLP